MKKEKLNKILFGLDIFIILLIIYFFIGYLNFNMIKNNKNPIYKYKITEISNKKYTKKIYKYGLYKIIKNEKINSNVSYSMKLWFGDEKYNEIER